MSKSDSATPTPPLSPDSTGLAGSDRAAVARAIAEQLGQVFDELQPYGFGTGFVQDDFLRAADAAAALTPSAPIAAPVRDDDDTAAAIANCVEAVAFFDQVKAASEADKIAVGRDHWNWLESACRRVASLPAPAGDVPGEAQTQAARDVLAERRRQVEAEGWTPEHDDTHDKGEIARAAATYAMAGAMQTSYLRDNFLGEWVNYKFSGVRSQWPGSWDWLWFKPSHPRRDLIKAGALILAEIERLDRSPGEAQTQEGER